jgi:hypothetical protein
VKNYKLIKDQAAGEAELFQHGKNLLLPCMSNV